MTAPRRWTVEAWWSSDGKTYTADQDGRLIRLNSPNQRDVVRFWDQINSDPQSAGIPTDADAAWVSDVRCEQQAENGDWFELTHIEPAAYAGCLWDNRDVPETTVDWRAMVEAHIASLHSEEAA